MTSKPGAPLGHLLSDAIARHASAGRLAMIGPGWSLTYAKLGGMIDRFANGIHAWTGEHGALIGIWAPKRVETIAAFLGAMQCGACPCILEPGLASHAVEERLSAARINHLVFSKIPEVSLEPLVKCGIRLRSIDSLLSDRGYRCENLRPADGAMVLFTSGSTGQPKGILLSHANLACNAEGVIDRTGITPEDRLLHIMPHFHTNGINNQIIAPLIAGATVALIEKFRADMVVALLCKFAATYATGVPTMYSRILTCTPGPYPREALRFLRCGSAPLTTVLHERVEEAFGVPLSVSYGLSEATCTSTMNPPFDRRIGTVGPALGNQVVELLDPDSGRVLGRGEEGEVCISGDAVMGGYIEDGIETVLTERRLRTGDLGTFDSGGYLSITGRIKDTIVRGGENLSPGLIERTLGSHPAVRACAVVGRPDVDLGEVPVAFVVRQDGLRTDEEDLSAHVLHRLSRIHVPAEFVLLDAIPENTVGKTDYRALKDMVRVRHQQ